jgi:hypothetical protein
MKKIKIGDYAIICKPIKYLPKEQGNIVKVIDIINNDHNYPIKAEGVTKSTVGEYKINELRVVTKGEYPEYFI